MVMVVNHISIAKYIAKLLCVYRIMKSKIQNSYILIKTTTVRVRESTFIMPRGG
jgi:hypothetical protein